MPREGGASLVRPYLVPKSCVGCHFMCVVITRFFCCWCITRFFGCWCITRFFCCWCKCCYPSCALGEVPQCVASWQVLCTWGGMTHFCCCCWCCWNFKCCYYPQQLLPPKTNCYHLITTHNHLWPIVTTNFRPVYSGENRRGATNASNLIMHSIILDIQRDIFRYSAKIKILNK